MLRFVFGLLICLGLCCTALLADTPGEEAVKDAIKTLKVKRAALKDKADQALLDTAIKDLEERLAQVGKGEPEPEAKKDEPFVMPKGWELKFNTGKSRPTYNPKTGELKLVYDFADAKQLKDFEYDAEVKPTIQKGVLTLKGGTELKHVARFLTIDVGGDMLSRYGCLMKIGAFKLVLNNKPNRGDFYELHENGGEITNVCLNGIGGNNQAVPLKSWYITRKLVGAKAGREDNSARRNESSESLGHLVLCADRFPNSYKMLTLTGTLDPKWAKEFFADKK
jgi:hypothetical protein